MIKKIKYKIKKNFLGIIILKIKFLFNIGLEKEAKYLKENYNFETAIDIGSNSGHYTNMLSRISKKVISVEPIKYHCDNQKILFKGKNIEVKNLALSNISGFKKFYVPNNNDPESSFIKKYQDSKKINVKISKGDDIFKFIKIDFIKIDVEGHEMNIIHGINKLLSTNKILLLIEIEKRHNKNYKKIFNYLRKKKYLIYYLNKNKKLQNIPYVNIDEFIMKNQNKDIINTKDYINNFFFKKKN